MAKKEDGRSLVIGGHRVALKHLDKPYFKEAGILKGDVIDYYIKHADLMLPHMKNRPFSMLHFPHGYGGEDVFYQKRRPEDAPSYVKYVTLPSDKNGSVDWCLVNNKASLIYMVNRSCIEMHVQTIRVPELEKPDLAVVDLDPNGKAGFREAAEVARAYREVLKTLGIKAMCKTSGATGIHIFIPVRRSYTYDRIKDFLFEVSRPVAAALPRITTFERIIKKRGDKILLDLYQNGHGRTLPPPYSLRATKNATFSAPLLWEELDDSGLSPENFTIKNIDERLRAVGDIAAEFVSLKQSLPK